ncbi:DUF4405 domain-containing protein [Rummeliibacillus sp. JY-2-4R]
MKKKNIKYIKFGIDLLMAITFVLFFNKRVLGGLTFHEIAGLLIAIVFFTHVLINWQWVKNVTLKLFDRRLPLKTKLNYLLNLLLLISMVFIIMSGIFISRVVFPNINIGNEQWFKMSHMAISFLVLVIVAVHVGLHWKWIMSVFKSIVKLKTLKKSFSILAKVATVALLLFGSYQMYHANFWMQMQRVTNVFNLSSSQMSEGRFKGGERPNFDGEGPTLPAGDFSDKDRPSDSEGNFGDARRMTHVHGEFKGDKGQSESANVFSVIIQYFAIMSVIIFVVYYIQKITTRKKRKINYQN